MTAHHVLRLSFAALALSSASALSAPIDAWEGSWARAGDPNCTITLSPGRGDILALSMSCGTSGKGFAQLRDEKLILVWRVPESDEAVRADCFREGGELACTANKADGSPVWADRLQRVRGDARPAPPPAQADTTAHLGTHLHNPEHGYSLRLPEGWLERPTPPNTLQSYEAPDGNHGLSIARADLPRIVTEIELRQVLASLRAGTPLMREELALAALSLAGRPGLEGDYMGDAEGTPVRTLVRLAQTDGTLFVVIAVMPRDDRGPAATATLELLRSFVPKGEAAPPATTAVQPGAQTLPPMVDAGVTFQDPGYGYRLVLPSGWQEIAPTGAVQRQWAKSGAPSHELAISVTPAGRLLSGDELKALTGQMAASTGMSLVSDQPLSVPQGIGHRMTLTGNSNGIQVKTVLDFISVPGMVFTVAGAVPLSAETAALPVVLRAINSFRHPGDRRP
jgi:hypothetical protein